MVTRERLERIKRQLIQDDDSILGNDKKKILSSIDKAIKSYKKYEQTDKLGRIHNIVMGYINSNIPKRVKEEACDIIVDLIDKNCEEEGIPTSRVSGININYINTLVSVYDLSNENKKTCEVALSKRAYIPGMFKYELTEDEEDEEND